MFSFKICAVFTFYLQLDSKAAEHSFMVDKQLATSFFQVKYSALFVIS